MPGPRFRCWVHQRTHWLSAVWRRTWVPALVVIVCMSVAGDLLQLAVPDARSIGGVIPALTGQDEVRRSEVCCEDGKEIEASRLPREGLRDATEKGAPSVEAHERSAARHDAREGREQGS